MPADPSIYSMIRPPAQQPGPLDNYSALMQLRAMGDASQLHGLQVQKLSGDLAEESAFKSAIADWVNAGGTGALPGAALAASPTRATAFEKTRLEGDKTRADIAKTRVETHGAQVKQLRDLTARVQSDADLAGLREAAMKLYGPEAGVNIPQSVTAPGFAEWQRREVMDADKFISQSTPKFEKIDVGGKVLMVDVNPMTNPAIKGTSLEKTLTPGESASQAETRRHNVVTERQGDLHYDADRGQLINKRTNTAIPVSGAGDQKLTESQGKALGFGQRAVNAHNIILDLEGGGTLYPGQIKKAAGAVPFIGGALETGVNALPGAMGGPNANQQKVEQAQRDFINAVLRPESGATITPAEFDNASKQYFPQPGDTDAVILQKQQARAREIDTLKAMAGPGASRFPELKKPKARGKGKDSLGGVLTPNPDGSFNYGFGGG